jgi:hypothetical protein
MVTFNILTWRFTNIDTSEYKHAKHHCIVQILYKIDARLDVKLDTTSYM